MELIAILDSAIKIGFGAVIAGFAALSLASRKHQYEIRRVQLDSELALFRTAIAAFDKASSSVNEFTRIFSRRAVATESEAANSSELERDLVPLYQALDATIEARTSSFLVGKVEIGQLMAEYANLLEELAQAYRTSSIDDKFLEANSGQRLWIRNQILQRLRGDFAGLFV